MEDKMHGKAEKRKQCKVEDRVIIRIWTSESNKDYPGNNVGHISIETATPKSYMSLWPVPPTSEQKQTYRSAAKVEQTRLKYFMEREAHYMTSYEDDYQAEDNQVPQVVVCLYSLDGADMQKKFEKLKNQIKTWRLIGSNMFVQNIEAMVEAATSKVSESEADKSNVDNCASLAYKLLKAGGIYEAISSSFSSKVSSVITPDDLVEAIVNAKKFELKSFPETQTFAFADETPLEVEKQSNCLIM